MIRVLYLLNHAGQGGTERYVRTLSELLNGKKTKAFFAYNEEGLLVKELKERNIETFKIDLKNRFDLRAAAKLAKLCKRLEIDIIHTQFLRENYIALLSRLFNPKVKVVYTNHMIVENDLPTRLTNRLLLPLEAGVVAVCSKGRDTLVRNGVSRSKIRVIFNAVDPAYWRDSDGSTLRTEFGIDNETFVIICVSRFSEEKGIPFLVRSLAELKKSYNAGFKCALVGDGPQAREIRQLVGSLDLADSVIFTGYRRDIKNLLHGSDLFVNPSQTEALSYAIIEALAAGLPVVASDVGGNGDIINSTTNCGLLVSYGDEEAMAAAVKRLMTEKALYEDCRRNALRTVEEIFNLAKMADETYNLYNECLKK